MSRTFAAGIDIGTATISAAVAMHDKTQQQFRLLGAATVAASGLRKGMVTDGRRLREQIRAVVREAERAADVPIRHAYLAAAGAHLSAIRTKGSVMIARADGEVTEHDMERVQNAAREHVPLTNRRMLHVVPLSYTIDEALTVRSPLALRGAKLESEMLFISDLYRSLQEAVASVEAAGVAVDDLISAPIAASTVLLSSQQKEVGAAVLDIGAEATMLAVFENGNAAGVAAFPIGSAHITHDIALGLQVSLREAEDLKCAFHTDAAARKKLHSIVEARLSDVFELVERYLKRIDRNGLLPGGVVCTGGGTLLGIVPEHARATLRLPAEAGQVRLFAPSSGLENPGLAVALGLCAQGLLEERGQESLGFSGARRAQGAVVRWLRSLLP